MLFDGLKAFRADDVLDPAGIGNGNLRIDSELLQPGGEKFMAFIDPVRDLFPALGQIDKAFRSYGNMIVFPELLHGNTDA